MGISTMKPIKLLIVLFLVPLWLFSQETPLNRLYDKYHDRKGFNAEEIIPGDMELDWEKCLRSDELQTLKKSIGSIRVMSLREDGKLSRDKFWTKMLEAVAKDDYIEFATMSGDRNRMMVYYLKSERGTVREFAMLFRGEGRVMLVTATGDMDMSLVFGIDAAKMWKDIGWRCGKAKACGHGRGD